MPFCTNCGKAMDAGNRFCAHCGAQVAAAGVSTVPPSAPLPPSAPALPTASAPAANPAMSGPPVGEAAAAAYPAAPPPPPSGIPPQAYSAPPAAYSSQPAAYVPQSGYGVPPTAPTSAFSARRFRPYAIALFLICAFDIFLAYTRYNSARHIVLTLFEQGDPVYFFECLYAVLAGIAGIVLFAFEPPAFLKLNKNGLIAFCALVAVLPILCWLPWKVPSLQQAPAAN